MRDEDYVIELCDEVLGEKAERQRRFPFLRGDPNGQGLRAMLPVDAFYPGLSLAVEYCERQHTEAVAFFDRRLTLSGPRAVQRSIYDQRRREILPAQGIVLVVFSYDNFHHDRRKRLLRQRAADSDVVCQRLSGWRR